MSPEEYYSAHARAYPANALSPKTKIETSKNNTQI
jgi:hypothetical protein